MLGGYQTLALDFTAEQPGLRVIASCAPGAGRSHPAAVIDPAAIFSSGRSCAVR